MYPSVRNDLLCFIDGCRAVFYAPAVSRIERKTGAMEYSRFVLNNEADLRRFEKKQDRNGENEKNRSATSFQKLPMCLG
jgi:hypothetical protein